MLYITQGLKRVDLVLSNLKVVMCKYHYHHSYYFFNFEEFFYGVQINISMDQARFGAKANAVDSCFYSLPYIKVEA